MRKLSSVKTNPSNPRQIKDEDYARLISGLRTFPEMLLKRPMICITDPADGKVFPLGGNQRYRGIREIISSPQPGDNPEWSKYRKTKSIPDEWVTLADDWNDAQRREFVIRDNVQSGEWDWPMLEAEYKTEELEMWGALEPEEEDNEDPPATRNVKKLPTIKITFKTTKQLQAAEIEIREALDKRYKGASYSVSAGEI